MRALVDTSAWIEFFHPRGEPAVQSAVQDALRSGLVVTVAPVLVELLAGLDPADQPSTEAIARLRALERLELDWTACSTAAEFDRKLAAAGQRAPTVDLILAGAAHTSRCEIWHRGDEHLERLAAIGGPPARDLSEPRATRR